MAKIIISDLSQLSSNDFFTEFSDNDSIQQIDNIIGSGGIKKVKYYRDGSVKKIKYYK